MLRIILSGCHGRMGQQVSLCCSRQSKFKLVAGLDHRTRNSDEYPIFTSPCSNLPPADVLIDFSHPIALDPLLIFCKERNLPALLAATGYTQLQMKNIREAALHIPVFHAPNLSIGANILLKLTQYASTLLEDSFEAVITERHHKSKLDAPSGTALMISDSIPQETQIFSVRAGTTAGEHTVMFAGQNEVLELFHRADSREVYALGALRAAQFLSQVNHPGLYCMDHLLNLKIRSTSH